MDGKNEKKNTFVAENAGGSYFFVICSRFRKEILFWRDARVVEEARLESVYTPKGYPGFESPSLRRNEREMRSKYNNNQLINLKN